ncbi:MAG: hypothetical protein NTV92_06240, partial [Candidatus Bipolaricaulota bacterium]|nr:hypothetical protein [Candidatus Bipolaricaulota bacterium]
MGAITVSFYPFDIGLAYLVPLDVSFSCWFFYLLYRFESVLLSVVGLGSVNHGQLGIEQGLGAWFSFALVLIWGIRKHLRHVIQIALHPDGSDSGEPMSYRLAFFGLIGGGIVFVGFWWAAGMNPLWSFLMMVTYL